MVTLTKTQAQLYVEDEGAYPAKYYGTPSSIWFIAEQPIIRAWIESKHQLDYDNEVWNQFTPNGEAFQPMGHREPLAFETNDALRRSLVSKLVPGKYVSFGKISPEGLSSFVGTIELHAKSVGGQFDEGPHGSVWLAPSNDGFKETLYVSLTLPEEHLTAICSEMIARPDAQLHVRANFAVYQEEIERRNSSGLGMFRLEVDAHIPIIEAQLTVVNPPEDEKRSAKTDTPPPREPAAPVIVHPDFSPMVMRLNWAIGLLVLLVLVCLFR